MIFHLGMSGSWRINPADIGKHDHLLLETDEEVTLSLNDPRRFGSLDLMPTAEVDRVAAVQGAWPGAARRRAERELVQAGIRGAQRGGEAAAARPEDRRGARQYLRLRSAVSRRDQPASSWREPDAAAAQAAGVRRSPKCWRKRSRRADRACATSPSPTASSAIFPSSSRFMIARASRAGVAARSSESSRAADRPSIARDASGMNRTAGLSGDRSHHLTRIAFAARGARRRCGPWASRRFSF